MPDASRTEVEIALDSGQSTAAMVHQSASAAARPATLILAHGAGAGQRHPFMVAFARGLSDRGLDVLTFDFLYMHQGRRVPDRMPQLVECYEAAIAWAEQNLASARERLFIGGKSMGGRAATHVASARNSVRLPLPERSRGQADHSPAKAGHHHEAGHHLSGIVLLGYPLHPPGRPDQLRDAHLPDVKLPMLFVQGTRDTFGTPTELAPIIDKLSPRPTMHAVDGGDHSFKIAGRDAAKRQAAVYGEIQDTIADWIANVSEPTIS